MKRCPKCNVVFEDEKRFCGKDGTTLVGEPFSLPSNYSSQDFDDEQETLIRARPADMGFSEDFSEPPPIEEDSIPIIQVDEPAKAPPPAVKPKGKFVKYLLMLVLGLFVGGVLVLGALGLGYFYLTNQMQKESVENSGGNPEGKDSKPSSTPAPESKMDVDHSKRNPNANEAKLNGSVIRKMVFVRSGPSRSSAKAGIVPRNDRLEIIKRENSTSPWYQVECEHGIRGWMHGNTIRFTK
ncbi:MAG: SH3 domain-containing protein [Pyrinomonadaceae bacterium]|nr:SH3 domain-containing protein [Pyrinomonadaceae bacterium]